MHAVESIDNSELTYSWFITTSIFFSWSFTTDRGLYNFCQLVELCISITASVEVTQVSLAKVTENSVQKSRILSY